MAEPARSRAELSEPARRRAGAAEAESPSTGSRNQSCGTARRLSALSDTESADFQDASEVPGSIWQAVAGVYGVDDDEGELTWQTDALCAQTDPEAFFPEKGGSTRDAKRVCSACPVRDECLDYAMAHDEKFGIWGGLSERERRRLRRAGR